ncbi:MAG: SigE family RNA polymerase sigma factor [Streptosporangiaceae bacterium]
MDEGEVGFTRFVEARGVGLLRFATAITGDRHQAEDLLQSVLERAYARWPKLVRHGDPEWYLRRSLVNAARDGWRSSRRKAEVLGRLAEENEGTYVPFDEVVTRDAVRRALMLLPQGQRTVLVLRYWEGLSEAETASLMGVSVGTVKSQAHRAMKALRTSIELIDDSVAEHVGSRR